VFLYALQTITGAMSTLTPPIALEHPANQNRVDYIQDVASQHDFDYPPVGRSVRSGDELFMLKNFFFMYIPWNWN
jgi:hypothetical protein